MYTLQNTECSVVCQIITLTVYTTTNGHDVITAKCTMELCLQNSVELTIGKGHMTYKLRMLVFLSMYFNFLVTHIYKPTEVLSLKQLHVSYDGNLTPC